MKPTGASARTFFVRVLRPMRCCSRANGAGPAVAPSFHTSDLAVEHACRRAAPARSGDDLREALGDELFAARPDPDLAAALDELRADAVVLPFDQPVAGGPSRARTRRAARRSDARGRTDTAGRRRRRRAGVARDQRRIARRRRAPTRAVGVAHHALRDELGVEPGELGQRALHQQLADADAKAAADQLVEQEAARRIELVQWPGRRLGLLLGRSAAQRQQPRLDPLREALVVALARRRQHVRDGLGEIADRLIALLEQPLGDARHGAARVAQARRRHHLARLAAGEEIHRPGRIAPAPPRRSSASTPRPWRRSRCCASSSAKSLAKRFMRRRCRRPARRRRAQRRSRRRPRRCSVAATCSAARSAAATSAPIAGGSSSSSWP